MADSPHRKTARPLTTFGGVEPFNLTFEFTPTGGETVTETDIRSKPNLHGDLVTCSFDVTQTFPEGGTVHLFGTVTGFFTPAS